MIVIMKNDGGQIVFEWGVVKRLRFVMMMIMNNDEYDDNILLALTGALEEGILSVRVSVRPFLQKNIEK